jgi:hypothetical protein
LLWIGISMSPRTRPVALIAACLIARAIPANAAEAPGGAPERPTATVLRLVIWYDRRRPFDSFRYRVYDLGKGQYTRAVDDWRALLARSYPDYTVITRDLAVPGGDPSRQIAAAVEEEEYNLARLILGKYGIGAHGRAPGYSRGYSGLRRPPRSPFRNEIPRSFPPLGASRTTPGPSPFFPSPFPYPRPHP